MDYNNLYTELISGREKLALVGLGYVGMPIAVEFAKHINVIGFDINEKRVEEYRNGIRFHCRISRDQFIMVIRTVQIQQMILPAQHLTALVQCSDIYAYIILFSIKGYLDEFLVRQADSVHLAEGVQESQDHSRRRGKAADRQRPLDHSADTNGKRMFF